MLLLLLLAFGQTHHCGYISRGPKRGRTVRRDQRTISCNSGEDIEEIPSQEHHHRYVTHTHHTVRREKPIGNDENLYSRQAPAAYARG